MMGNFLVHEGMLSHLSLVILGSFLGFEDMLIHAFLTPCYDGALAPDLSEVSSWFT